MRGSLFRRISAAGPILAASLLSLSGFSACDKGTGEEKLPLGTTSEVIADVSSKVIYAIYTDLAVQTEALQGAVDRLAKTPSDANLATAQQAWRNARVPWEHSEAFLFGPVMNLNTDGPVDSWPLNQVDLEKVLQSNAALTKGYVDSLGVNLKGFHTLEYLLFGDTAQAQSAANLSPRELEYLKATTASLLGEVKALRLAWDPAGENFLGTLQNAGKGSDIYLTEQQAVEELLAGISGICGEVANEKMYTPFHTDPPDPAQEESRFSNNSTADFANNLRGARDVYVGGYGGKTGHGLKDLVERKDPALAKQVLAEFDAALAATLAMGVFTEAIFNTPQKVEDAITTVRTLKFTLAVTVSDALGIP